jgi:hypothetical protein
VRHGPNRRKPAKHHGVLFGAEAATAFYRVGDAQIRAAHPT